MKRYPQLLSIWRAAAIMVTALAIGRGAAGAEPFAVEDALGRRVLISSEPRRIVPIFASSTEIVAALGLTDRIVGIESFTHYPPGIETKPIVGGRLGFSVDAIVAQRPDLIILTPSRQAANQIVDPMQRVGVPVLVLLQRSVAEVIANIRLVGRACGVPNVGETVAADLERRLRNVAKDAPAVAPRVLLITGSLGNGLVLVARPRTYTGDAIRLAGGRFALSDSNIPQISPEAIFRSDPDILLFAGTAADLRRLTERSGWRDLSAVKSGHAFAVPRAELLIPGPRTLDGVERLSRIFRDVQAANR